MPHLPFSSLLTEHRQAAAITLGILAAAATAWLALRRPRPDPDKIEQARRERLARFGRITDGTLVDTTSPDGSSLGRAVIDDSQAPTPRLLLFRYRIAGVAYEAVQDVSTLPEHVRNLRIDLPIQVRYDHGNPADSIVVAESWNGLRFETGLTPPPIA